MGVRHAWLGVPRGSVPHVGRREPRVCPCRAWTGGSPRGRFPPCGCPAWLRAPHAWELPLLTPLPMALLSLRGHSWEAAAAETAEKNPPSSAPQPPPRTPLPTAPPRTAPPLRTPPRGRAVNGGGRSRVGAAVHVEVGYSGLGGSAEPSRFSQSGPGSPSPVPVQPLPSQFNQYGPSTPSAIPLLPLRSQFSQYRVPSTVPVVIVWSQFNPVPSQFNQ